MSYLPSESEPSTPHASQLEEVKSWLASHFDAAGKDVPEFEYTSLGISYLHSLATLSQAKTQSALILANDFRQKAAEYHSQAARITEILENVGLEQESLPTNVVALAQILANVANSLDIRDIELSSSLVAMGDISLRKARVEEQTSQARKESRFLLDHTRKAIARLTYLKRVMGQLEDDIDPCEALMEKWETNLAVMAAKDKQYVQQHANFKDLINRIGYTPEISHSVLVEMANQLEELGRKTEPIVTTLKSYLDLPPDTEMAALAVEDKRREYDAAEKYLEDVLESALDGSE